ncbi:MAG: DNA mismatch repair protein MutS, partial [Betaproteobacteria bacterium]|nr:DNA mismatch repair protein MutS [Betaproteobacteria bacterium]
SRSYGIQVAQLAGVPAAVLREARQRLKALEAMAGGGSHSAQGSLFGGGAPEYDEGAHGGSHLDSVSEQNGGCVDSGSGATRVLDRLREADADALSPRDALALIYQLKKDLGE